MRIAIFITSLDKRDGGPARSVPLLAKGLSEIGLNITLITCASAKMNTHIIENSDVQLEIIDKNISLKALEKFLISGKYDIIHSQNLWNPLYHKVAILARRHYIPYIMTPRGCLEPWSLSQKKFKKALALLLYQKKDLQKASCILATSYMEAENIRNLGIINSIAIIPNGINTTEYRCRDTLYKSRVKKQICFISRIHEKKGIEILISAWKRINIKYPDWNIIVAGNGEDNYIKKLKDLVKKNNLQETFTISPPIFGQDKLKLYRESALFVLPTYSENFGMVIAEAMSCGLPVITTNGTPWQILNSNNLGWCIDLSLENLITALSIAIEKGIDDLFEMGQKCSEYIYSTFHYREIAKQNKILYEWILTGKHKPKYII